MGQDDIIGDSSDQFGLTAVSDRPTGTNTVFGGAGTQTRTSRNDLGDTSADGHARDADCILGDNGNVFRLISTSSGAFLTLNYDSSDPARGGLRIIPRAFVLLDYTLCGDPSDRGADDLLHGEAGDDVIHGMTGNDVMFAVTNAPASK